MHRGGTTPVHFWGAIGYNYKGTLVHIQGTGKHGAFKQVDYLSQVLQPYIQKLLLAFELITSPVRFIEDGNSAHGHKSIYNVCARFRALAGIILFPHPAISPDMNPIEKVWRRIKQSIHRRRRQPTTESEMIEAVMVEWEQIPQEWINSVIRKHPNYVRELVQNRGWSTSN